MQLSKQPNALYKVSPLRLQHQLEVLEHPLFAIPPLITITLDYYWTEPPTFVTLPPNLDIESAIDREDIDDEDEYCINHNWDESKCPDIKSTLTEADIGRFGWSRDMSSCPGRIFIVVWVCPYSKATHQIFGVIYPHIIGSQRRSGLDLLRMMTQVQLL